MGSVCRDEVHQSGFVTQIVSVVCPMQVRHEPCILGQGEERPPREIQRRVPHIAATRDIDGAEIERQTNQIVLQGAGGEFVDFIGDAACDTADDRTHGRFSRHQGLAVIARVLESERIKEGFEQAQLIHIGGREFTDNVRGVDGFEIAVEAVHRVGQHGVAEAIDRL